MAHFSDSLSSTGPNGVAVATPARATGANSVDAIRIVPTANAADANVVTITNAAFAQASQLTIPDPGAASASFALIPNGAGSAVLTATSTLNATQMAAAYATPVQLIPAPGAGLCILITNAYVSTHKGATAFATGTAPIIQYGSTAHGAGTIATASGLVAGDITATTDQTRNLFPIATGAQTGLSNTGIYFSNATGAYTAGSGSTVSFTLCYVVVSSAN